MAEIGNFVSILPNSTYASAGNPYFIPAGSSSGGNTYPANAQFSSIVVNTQPGVAGVAIEENSNGYASLYFNTPTSSDVNYQLQTTPTANPAVRTLYLNATAVNTDGALRGNANLTTLSFPDANLNISSINGIELSGTTISNGNASVECSSSSVVQVFADSIVLNSTAGIINATTSPGANFYLGSLEGTTPANATKLSASDVELGGSSTATLGLTAGSTSVALNNTTQTTTITSPIINLTGANNGINLSGGQILTTATASGATLQVGSLGINSILMNTSTVACEYNLTCKLFNGLAPPVVFGVSGNVLAILAGNFSVSYTLPPLTALGYFWTPVCTPDSLLSIGTSWAVNVVGDVVTIAINQSQAGNVTFNLVASATK